MNLTKTLTTAALLLSFGVACSPSVGSVDRTQPNALKKTMFAGIWYYRSMVVEADPEAPIFEGSSSDMEKIRWKIQKDRLVAYRSYEFIPYAEGMTDEGRDFFGAPVAAFKIESHFDIQREYNATTGVETNVISENTTDRPWNEREYIRVDWSNNIVGTPTLLWTGWSGMEASFSANAMPGYYTQSTEATDPNRPYFVDDYFDITNNFAVQPSVNYCYWLLLYNGAARCGAANVRMRLAFKKIDETDDYETMYYPDELRLTNADGESYFLDNSDHSCSGQNPDECTEQTFPYDAAFGNFRIYRQAFDEEQYLTRTGRIYLAGRYDLWEDNFAPDGTKIPYAERTPKPVVFYGDPSFPNEQEMIASAKQMGDNWAGPLEDVVAFKMGLLDADGKPDRAAAQEKAGGRMFQFVVNSCNPDAIWTYAEQHGLTNIVEDVVGGRENINRANVANVCAAVQYAQLQAGATLDPAEAEKDGVELAFQWQRLGDLRYNFENYVEENQAGPWGIAQFAQDPETGEFIGANVANYFGNAGDRIAQSEVDVIQWLNGDLSSEDLYTGEEARKYVVSKRAAGQSTSNLIHRETRKALQTHEDELLKGGVKALFPDAVAGIEDTRFRQLWKGTKVESELLVTEDVLRTMAGADKYQPESGVSGAADVPVGVSDKALAAASPVNWGVTMQGNDFLKSAEHFGAAAVDMAAFFDPNSTGMANTMKGWSRDAIYGRLRTILYGAVMMHEVGHTLGLRHNFRGSMDPQNYRPDFWYRCADGSQNCDAADATQAWNNPPTATNPTQSNELKYASIMDYAFDIPLEGYYGVGSYDAAAIRFQYGEILEVWDNDKVSLPDPRKFGNFARNCGSVNDFYGLPGLLWWMGPEAIPKLLSVSPNGQSGCSDTDTSCDTAADAIARNLADAAGQFSDTYPNFCYLTYAAINSTMEQANQLTPNAANVYAARKMVDASVLIDQKKALLSNMPEYDDPATAADESTDNVDNDGDGLVDSADKGYDWDKYQYQVQYAYCSDFQAGYTNPFCQRWDTGWDMEEAVEYQANRVDRDYIFNHFRRERWSEWNNPSRYLSRLIGRRLVHMTNVFKFYLYSRGTIFQSATYTGFQNAAYKGVNFLERMLQAPEPGTYCLDAATRHYGLQTDASAACASPLEVGLGYGEGQFLDSAWTNEYYYRLNRIGFFYDKLAALAMLTSNTGSFYQDYSGLFDSRAFSLGYLRVYLDPMLQRFSALIQGDHTGYRAHVVQDSAGTPYVRYMPFFDEEDDSSGTETGTPGQSIRNWLTAGDAGAAYPTIDPAWSFTLQYYALAFAMSSWSDTSSYAPEIQNLVRVAVKGTKEDMDFGSTPVVEFTDPETQITYRAPEIRGQSMATVTGEFPPYYGYSRLGGNYHPWGAGGAYLAKMNDYVTTVYTPADAACTASGDSASAACTSFQAVRRELRERVGFIDRLRLFVDVYGHI